MTDEIIIDGIDVNECMFLQFGRCEATRDVYGDCNYDCKDDDMKNCYYKQLKRKEQDCEQLKAENETLKQHFKQIDLTNKILYEEKINFLDLINKLVKYCLNCNLKADSTACEILEIIEDKRC